MARKVIEINVSSTLANQLLNVEQELGARVQSLTVVTVPGGVSLELNWAGVKVVMDEGDVLEGENLSQVYLTTTGTSSLKLVLVASTATTFWKRLALTKVAKYQATPGSYADGSVLYLLTDINGRLRVAGIEPIAKAALFNTALPAAEANLLGTDITPTNSPSYLRIYVCMDVSGVFRVARTVGGVNRAENLNSGAALIAGAAYMFSVPWRSGDSINFRYSVTTGIIDRLLVDEIQAAE